MQCTLYLCCLDPLSAVSVLCLPATEAELLPPAATAATAASSLLILWWLPTTASTASADWAALSAAATATGLHAHS